MIKRTFLGYCITVALAPFTMAQTSGPNPLTPPDSILLDSIIVYELNSDNDMIQHFKVDSNTFNQLPPGSYMLAAYLNKDIRTNYFAYVGDVDPNQEFYIQVFDRDTVIAEGWNNDTLFAKVFAISHGDSITLLWTATGDDGDSGTATAYDIRYRIPTFANDSITDGNWAQCAQLTSPPSPKIAGSPESFTFAMPSGDYYFAIKARDEANLWSPLSNNAFKTHTGTSQFNYQILTKWYFINMVDSTYHDGREGPIYEIEITQ